MLCVHINGRIVVNTEMFEDTKLGDKIWTSLALEKIEFDSNVASITLRVGIKYHWML